MFIIKKTTHAGTVNTGIECETIEQAHIHCSEGVEGKAPCDDSDDSIPWFRLEVYEVLANGNLDLVCATGFYSE